MSQFKLVLLALVLALSFQIQITCELVVTSTAENNNARDPVVINKNAGGMSVSFMSRLLVKCDNDDDSACNRGLGGDFYLCEKAKCRHNPDMELEFWRALSELNARRLEAEWSRYTPSERIASRLYAECESPDDCNERLDEAYYDCRERPKRNELYWCVPSEDKMDEVMAAFLGADKK